jgi:hypothetical protein
MSGRVSNATGRPRRKLRFSLKALMVGIALCASPMGEKDGRKDSHVANQAPSDRTICTCGSNSFMSNELRSPEARALHVLSTRSESRGFKP